MPTPGNIDYVESLGDKEYAFLAKLVEERAGIILRGERHRNMVHGRLIRRLRALNIPSFSAYCQLLQDQSNDEEILHVINSITTNVTSFFRENHHFEHLKKYLHHLAAKTDKLKRLRIWSAACSSGEEPYSIAMSVCEAIEGARHKDVKILATDIDTNILERGKEGKYSISALEAFPKGYEARYTSSVDTDTFTLTPEIKRLVHFKHLNLLHEWPVKGPFDAIFCRNVFIYFNPETQAAIASRFADLLEPGGYLYIGHSENLLHLTDRLEHAGKTIYRKVQ